MDKLKKTTAVLVALGITGGASAAAYEEPAPVCPNVGLPCVFEGWSFGVDYMWVQPTTDSLQYAQVTPDDIDPGVNITTVLPFRKPAINPGFNSSALRLEAGYYWDTGRYAKLDWTHLFDRNTGRQSSFPLPVDGAPTIGNGFIQDITSSFDFSVIC